MEKEGDQGNTRLVKCSLPAPFWLDLVFPPPAINAMKLPPHGPFCQNCHSFSREATDRQTV